MDGKGLIIYVIQSKMLMISSSARVAELADALDLGSSRETYRGSNPLSRTIPSFFHRQNPDCFIVSLSIFLLLFSYYLS